MIREVKVKARSIVGRISCRMRWHAWRYFIDGSLGRYCRRCPAVQYDIGVSR